MHRVPTSISRSRSAAPVARILRAVTGAACVLAVLCGASTVDAKSKKKKEDVAAEDTNPAASAGTFSGLAFREIGPALMSGRVADLAVDPQDTSRWIVGVASGGVWITENAGTTWKPVFDGEASYSIGVVTLDPNDAHTVWVGTGENNSQRSVAYGDGVYKSTDGGRSWKNVGLETSEHIGKIVVDPRDSDTVFVAAQGPLWRGGGERGLYKTIDGGETWRLVLEIDDYTGVNEVVYDPRNPDHMLASSYQRQRRTWTLVNGGPGSGVWRSTDAGETWTEITAGLPSVDMGRIGFAVSPADPDVVYAIVEAQDDAGGVFRSTNFGVTWEKRGDYMSSSPQYYNELVADPDDVSRVYSLDTWMHVSEDGGKTFRKVGEKWKHVDNHALWIDPEDTRHMVAGCDGGIYETFDRGGTWKFAANLPITQFYKVSVDEDAPFYNVYGGTQDNATQGGPARTTSLSGITNRDWYVTVMGDGFKTQVDPTDPDVVYSQWQYGGLVRYDRGSGEVVDIQPQPEDGEDASRWNWSSPLIISPHDHERLYYASQRVHRSDDRGGSWRAVSPDLTRRIDRNTLEIMGEVQSVDAVAKNASTSFYGNVVSLDESARVEGLIYAGTDDGLVQVTEDGGETWRKIASFPGVPDGSYVSSVIASLHDDDTAYATFDNHKAGDFTPYVLKTSDRGATWSAIAGGLPDRGHAHMIIQDHVDPNLLFLGTEFGVFFTVDEGGAWVQLRGGVPTIAVRDLAIQRRENDLVLGTFGRGFWVLDDYTPLRGIDEATLERDALFPVRDALAYIETMPLGLPGKSMQGDAFYTAENPPFGAVLTYRLAEEVRSKKDARRADEKEKGEAGEAIGYPSWDALRAEDREEAPTALLIVRDPDGNVVRRVRGPASSGFHRVAWDLRYPPSTPTRLTPWPTDNPFSSAPAGPLAAPGTYTVTLAVRVDGATREIDGATESFDVVPLHLGTLAPADRAATLAFQQEVARLQRAVLGAQRAAGEADERLNYLTAALDDTPGIEGTLGDRARALRTRLADARLALEGDGTIARRNEPTPPSIVGRVSRVVGGSWSSTSAPTGTHRDNFRIAEERFKAWLPDFRRLVGTELEALERAAEEAGAPWTPGRVPRYGG